MVQVRFKVGKIAENTATFVVALVGALAGIVAAWTGVSLFQRERKRDDVRREMDFADDYKSAYRRRVYNHLTDAPASERQEVGPDRTVELRRHQRRAGELLGHEASKQYGILLAAEAFAQRLWAFSDGEKLDAGKPEYPNASNMNKSVEDAVSAIVARCELLLR